MSEEDDQPRNPRKPWRKLWCDESSDFGQLSLSARALAAYVLKLADDGGRIGTLDRRTPANLIAWLAGASRSDRRMLARTLPELLERGYLLVRDGALFVANFERYQVASRAGELRGKPRAKVCSPLTKSSDSPETPSGHERPPKVETTPRNHSGPLPEGELRADDLLADNLCACSRSEFSSSASCSLLAPSQDLLSESKPPDYWDRFKSEPLSPQSVSALFFAAYRGRYPGAYTEAFTDRWRDEIYPTLCEWWGDDDDEIKRYLAEEIDSFCALVTVYESETVQSSAFALCMGKIGTWSSRRAEYETGDDGTASPWVQQDRRLALVR